MLSIYIIALKSATTTRQSFVEFPFRIPLQVLFNGSLFFDVEISCPGSSHQILALQFFGDIVKIREGIFFALLHTLHNRLLNFLIFIKILQITMIPGMKAIFYNFWWDLFGMHTPILFSIENSLPFSPTWFPVLIGCCSVAFLLVLDIVCCRHHILVTWQLLLCLLNLPFYTPGLVLWLGDLLILFNFCNVRPISTSLIAKLFILLNSSGVKNLSAGLACSFGRMTCCQAVWNRISVRFRIGRLLWLFVH